MKPVPIPKVVLEKKVKNHRINITVTAMTISLWMILFITSVLISLPFVFVDIGVKSQSTIRPLTYKNIITAPISARVKAIFIEDN